MAIVTKTMEEIKKEMTPEKIKEISEALKYRPIVYDEDCPPQTDEELKMYKRVVPKKQVI